ncbi:MAG: hypothetical protein BWX84_01730 [Verrucomicrobia bacterium ADurb.Bin118]|nr:MAG: hypothetical protein BWX84_01730 [Verrucomicrobia bacterium ADurb.Bin118]
MNQSNAREKQPQSRGSKTCEVYPLPGFSVKIIKSTASAPALQYNIPVALG